MARALERQAQREVQSLKRGLGVLATVGSTAPFVGLLGTVMGIVNAFQPMAAPGSGGLGTVSAGIAEALITTAFGLLVAIPAVMAYNYLQGWVDARAVDISESSNEFLDVVAKQVGGVRARRRRIRGRSTRSRRGDSRHGDERQAARQGIKNDINITPLVDVVLVLLIIFMVVTPMLQRGKDVKLPAGARSRRREAQGEPDPLIVSVTPDKQIFVERTSSTTTRSKQTLGAEAGRRARASRSCSRATSRSPSATCAR